MPKSGCRCCRQPALPPAVLGKGAAPTCSGGRLLPTGLISTLSYGPFGELRIERVALSWRGLRMPRLWSMILNCSPRWVKSLSCPRVTTPPEACHHVREVGHG